MRRILFAMAWVLGLALAAPAQDGTGTAIEGVISDQIEAFRQDDFATAFTFASPGIRQLFGTPERFGAMVRNGYPMVYRPAEVECLGLEEAPGALNQKVMMRDAGGSVHILQYRMIRVEDGWQIDGVRVIEAPQVGA